MAFHATLVTVAVGRGCGVNRRVGLEWFDSPWTAIELGHEIETPEPNLSRGLRK